MAPYFSKFQRIGLALTLLIAANNLIRKKRYWSKKWLVERSNLSHVNIARELNPADFRNFMRMDSDSFIELLNLVAPLIQKQDTLMRKSVSAHERLMVTLRFLTTGESYEDLKFSAAVSPQLLSEIIPETCRAIYKCLKQYIKVSY